MRAYRGPARGWLRGEAKALLNKRSKYNPDTDQLQGARAIATALATRIETLTEALLGPPTSKRGDHWRWGRHGSLTVHIDGNARGRWYSFEEGRGGDALDLVAFATGDTLQRAMGWARTFLRGSTAERRVATPTAVDRMRRTSSSYAMAIWRKSLPLAGSPAAKYLAGRGVALAEWPADLRFHPACPFGNDRVPCLVALVRTTRTDRPLGIHRTAIKPDGSGKLFHGEREHENKKALGTIAGGVVKLSPDDAISTGLALCEGIETGLSLLAVGHPVWCTLGTAGLHNVEVLPGIESLTVFADHDANGAGERAAVACGKRWQEAGREVRITRPKRVNTDWNDVHRRYAQ